MKGIKRTCSFLWCPDDPNKCNRDADCEYSRDLKLETILKKFNDDMNKSLINVYEGFLHNDQRACDQAMENARTIFSYTVSALGSHAALKAIKKNGVEL